MVIWPLPKQSTNKPTMGILSNAPEGEEMGMFSAWSLLLPLAVTCFNYDDNLHTKKKMWSELFIKTLVLLSLSQQFKNCIQYTVYMKSVLLTQIWITKCVIRKTSHFLTNVSVFTGLSVSDPSGFQVPAWWLCLNSWHSLFPLYGVKLSFKSKSLHHC